MKIIKRGVPPTEREHTATCTRCGTVINFQQSEARYESDQRDGDYLAIACPVCLATITKAVRS